MRLFWGMESAETGYEKYAVFMKMVEFLAVYGEAPQITLIMEDLPQGRQRTGGTRRNE
jgi:hypothetical protein